MVTTMAVDLSYDAALNWTTSPTLLDRIRRGAVSGDWRNFQSLYRELIMGFARRVGFHQEACEDIYQDVMIILIRRLPNWAYDPKRGRLRGYLKTVTIRACFKILRQNRRSLPLEVIEERLLMEAKDPFAERWESEYRDHLVRTGLEIIRGEFSERDVNVFIAYAIEREPASDVAEAFGVSTSNVHQIKHRILARLQEIIRKMDKA